jgi:hypothetical protein
LTVWSGQEQARHLKVRLVGGQLRHNPPPIGTMFNFLAQPGEIGSRNGRSIGDEQGGEKSCSGSRAGTFEGTEKAAQAFSLGRGSSAQLSQETPKYRFAVGNKLSRQCVTVQSDGLGQVGPPTS